MGLFFSESEISDVHDKPTQENPNNKVTNDKKDEIEEDYEDEEEEEDDDDDWDWNESGGGDFTKRYSAMRTGYNQQVFISSSICMGKHNYTVLHACCLFPPG